MMKLFMLKTSNSVNNLQQELPRSESTPCVRPNEDDLDLIVDFPEGPRRRSTGNIGGMNRVKFSSTNSLYRLDEYRNGGDPRATWYTKMDYKSFRRDTQMEVFFARQRQKMHEKNETRRGSIGLSIEEEEDGDDNDDGNGKQSEKQLRGIEDCDPKCTIEEEEDKTHLTGIQHLVCKENLHETLKQQEDHRKAVIEEYWRQVEQGDWDPNSVRKISRSYSSNSVSRACEYAAPLAFKR
mmetsp:Transcript_9155/g.19535  ORF Transcript_9155/g.19535 Transcript_9155/m.19535 type:complete len:238 (+) Transcript_9155:77-790(+)